MTKVKMPASLEEAVGALSGIEKLLQAREWERAAIVATFVRPEASGGRPAKAAATSGFLNVEQFAALGVQGLRSKDTVKMYLRRWLDASGSYPEPGEEVTLPVEKWPPADRGTDGYDSTEGAENTVAKIIEKHGSGPVRAAVAKLPREQRAQVESDLIESAIENIGAPFDTPPPIPGEDRPLRPGYAITEACVEFTKAGQKLLGALHLHNPLEDPVADRAVDQVLDMADAIATAIRERMGVGEVHVS
jgi:hypothetical protein